MCRLERPAARLTPGYPHGYPGGYTRKTSWFVAPGTSCGLAACTLVCFQLRVAVRSRPHWIVPCTASLAGRTGNHFLRYFWLCCHCFGGVLTLVALSPGFFAMLASPRLSILLWLVTVVLVTLN